ncbi:MAG TPA: C-type lectin domain-containing protein [Polyangiaceae bacterium]|nr:C-type lectin domain-containing protein [Polyangiaceae bacterium]HNZ23923.1 C-type lectin domain-containing protein [Polyangiaceae bacterium]HOD23342.1 C-type lectin domain-containing protein [Polyangiaceae bacterium]HOE50069.1 C-type lectin domain-containing protein [Polyangiaceae bacterium]HOH01772.1 C-type lectin domain-containing protein [Polyangiaceae bacterium]
MSNRWLRFGLLVGCLTACGTAGDNTRNYASAKPDAADDVIIDATGDPSLDKDTPPPKETGPEVSADTEPDTPADVVETGPETTTPDVEQEAEAEAGCPTGTTGPNCDACADGYFECGASCIENCEDCPGKTLNCDGQCVTACHTCPGQPAACGQTCMSSCATCDNKPLDCQGTCIANCDACPEKPLQCNAKCVATCNACPGQPATCGQACLASCATCDNKPLDCQGTCVSECAQCAGADYSCQGACIASCMSCAGQQATCETTHECLSTCSSCSGSCLECPAGYHACPNGCHIDGQDDPALGCAYTCDDQPCPIPENGDSICSMGNCDIVCDTPAGFIKVGSQCLCDADHGFVKHPTLPLCVCENGFKGCGTFCASVTDPAYGCSHTYCLACPTPPHTLTTFCNASGECDFTCDDASGYIKNSSGTDCVCPSGLFDNGTSCGCEPGLKYCNGSCVSASTPNNGCAGPSCDPCPTPAHATAICDAGACSFVCDASGHWKKSGNQCICDNGYTEVGGECVTACLGSTYGSSCYWYVGTAATWDQAQANCAAQGGYLASIANSAENTFVRSLGSDRIWIGLRDHSTDQRTFSKADDCTQNIMLSGDGGTYFGSTTNSWDDIDPCNISSDSDDIFGIEVTTPGIYVFSTANTSWDTILGLYRRVANTSGYTSCLGSNLACDDDSGPGTRSLIIRYLDTGSYTLVLDGYYYSWGSYQLDVRRFDLVDGTIHQWANWASDEPNNSSSAEKCVEMNTAGTWNDLSCASTRSYVCERPM